MGDRWVVGGTTADFCAKRLASVYLWPSIDGNGHTIRAVAAAPAVAAAGHLSNKQRVLRVNRLEIFPLAREQS